MEEIELTQEEINEINKGIPFVDAKLYWKEGYGWTSQYWEKLYKVGWRMVESEEEPGVFLLWMKRALPFFRPIARSLYLSC